MFQIVKPIFIRFLTVLIFDKKFGSIRRVLTEYIVCKKAVKKLSPILYEILLKTWKNVPDDFSPSKENITLLFNSNKVINAIHYKLEPYTSKIITMKILSILRTRIIDLFICLSFKSIQAINRQIEEDNDTSALNNVLLVKTCNGTIHILDYYTGVKLYIVYLKHRVEIKNRPNITHNEKLIHIIPSFNGSLYSDEFFPRPLGFSMNDLLILGKSSNQIFTGNTITEVTSFEDANEKYCDFPLESRIPKIPLLIKYTSHSLTAKDPISLNTEWEITATENEIFDNNLRNTDDSIGNQNKFLIKLFPKSQILQFCLLKISSNGSKCWGVRIPNILDVWQFKNNKLIRIDAPELKTTDKNFFVLRAFSETRYIEEPLSTIQELVNFKVQTLDDVFKNCSTEDFISNPIFSNIIDTTYFSISKKSTKINRSISNASEKDVYNSVFESIFKYDKRLGVGGFGHVIKATHIHDDKVYAIKRIIFDSDKEIDKIQREVKMQVKLEHKNIVRYYSSWSEKPPIGWIDPFESLLEDEDDDMDTFSTNYDITKRAYFYIQMELCEYGDLYDWLENNRSIEIRKSRFTDIFKQIVDGLCYIHEQGLAHRDLKPKNIFFYSSDIVKIGDFGLATKIQDCVFSDMLLKHSNHPYHTPGVGTPPYIAPEQNNHKKYSYKVDIWALGIILVELVNVFKTYVEKYKIFEELCEGRLPDSLITSFPDEYKLLRLMLSHDPNKRPSIYGVKAHSPLKEDVEEKYYFKMPNEI